MEPCLEPCGFCKVESRPVIGLKMGPITSYFCSTTCAESWINREMPMIKESTAGKSTSTNAFKQAFKDLY